MKKLFSIILILVLICTSVTIVYGGDNYITVRDVVNRLDKVAGSYNPQYTKEKLLSSSSFVLDEDVTKAQCYYLISRAFDNFPQLQGDCLANAPSKVTYYDMPMWAGNEIGKMISCGLVDNDGSGAFYPLQNVTEKEFDTILQRVYRLYGTNNKDDFYSYVNHNELLEDNSDKLEDTGNVNTIDEAQKHNVEMFNDIVNECIDGSWEKGSKESAIQNLYLTIQDFKTRNEQGVEPIKPFLDQLSQVKDDSQLNAFVEDYTKKTSMPAFVNFSLAPQPNDEGKYGLYFDCYVPLMYISVSQNPDELERYKKYITDMFELAGESNKKALEDAENVLNVEKLLSSDIIANGDSEFMETVEADGFDDSSNIMEKLYKSYDIDTIDRKFKTLDLKAIVKAFGYDENSPLIIWDMNRVNKLSELFNGEHSQELASLQKAYMISIGGMYLSQDFYDLYDNFLMDIYGTDQSVLDQNMAPRTFISNQMSIYISQIFCQKYFDKSKKEQVIKAAAIAAVILISGVFYTVKQQSETGAAKAAVVHTEESVTQEETENTQNVTGQEEQKALCYVYICGAVVSPGVYEVPEHTRIYEVVELADGFTPEADDTVLNLAENVLDGQKLYIPKQGEVTEKADTAQDVQGVGKVNINTADKTALMTLPGIGASKAEDIIQYRKENGSFQKIEDIKKISGIKDAAFNKIKELICV